MPTYGRKESIAPVIPPPAAPLDDPLSNMGNYWDEFNRRTNAGQSFSEVTRDVRSTAPYELLGAYQGVARTGIYGQNGVNNIMQNVGRSNALRRKALANALMRKQGRRLGTRAGGIQTMIANQVQAPGLAGEADTRANLLAQNLQSRLGGLQGMESVLALLMDQYNAKKAREQDEKGPGVLDWVSVLLDAGGDTAKAFAGASGGGDK